MSRFWSRFSGSYLALSVCNFRTTMVCCHNHSTYLASQRLLQWKVYDQDNNSWKTGDRIRASDNPVIAVLRSRRDPGEGPFLDDK